MLGNNLTISDILSSNNPYITVTNYVIEFVIQYGKDALLELSQELQDSFAIVELDSEYYNGGLEQYFGNRTFDDGRLYPEVEVALKALNIFGATKLSELVAKALAKWTHLVHERLKQPANNAEERHQWFETMRLQMSAFNSDWEEEYDKAVLIISAYMQSKASKFCHLNLRRE